jgi:hypothetical protein
VAILHMFDASLQLCGDKHPGFSCLNELTQDLVFFRLPGLMLLPGHYALFALGLNSTRWRMADLFITLLVIVL